MGARYALEDKLQKRGDEALEREKGLIDCAAELGLEIAQLKARIAALEAEPKKLANEAIEATHDLAIRAESAEAEVAEFKDELSKCEGEYREQGFGLLRVIAERDRLRETGRMIVDCWEEQDKEMLDINIRDLKAALAAAKGELW